ncbi:pep-cterm sorting domain-containing protein [Anaeramoeba ignava]|uniref:Pep-cterm sorting domain-containing protein n=1 Tax=Anaeramoeba ignava TaxID=1746090 RepID=A0A9Q0R897_ANAIG|nr:pep-cterm sorting domain-containing protein [Anaeramoeba ignava]
MIQHYSNTEKLSQDLQKLISLPDKENYSDFEIICKENQQEISFKCHKSILSTRNDFFRSLLHSQMKEFQENKLILKDVSKSTLKSILEYFYSGKIQLTLENVIEILLFSSRYLIDDLQKPCVDFVKRTCAIENVVEVLKIAELVELSELTDFCYKFIFENFAHFIKTDFFLDLEEDHFSRILSNDNLQIPEFEIFQSLVQWGQRQCSINRSMDVEIDWNKEENQAIVSKMKEKISNLIHKIRFINLEKTQISQIMQMKIIPDSLLQTIDDFHSIPESNENEMNLIVRKYQQKMENKNSLIFNTRIRFQSNILKDKQELENLKSLIDDDIFFSSMKLGFSAKKHGFSNRIFHYRIDGKGKMVVLIETTEEYVFGGFTKVGYQSGNPRYITDDSSFIFSLRNPTSKTIQKFPIHPEMKNKAIYYNEDAGPAFGGGYDFWINSGLEHGWSNLGNTYQLPKEMVYGTPNTKSYLAGSFNNWKVKDIEVFVK